MVQKNDHFLRHFFDLGFLRGPQKRSKMVIFRVIELPWTILWSMGALYTCIAGGAPKWCKKVHFFAKKVIKKVGT